MMQFPWVDLQQVAFSALQELSANSDRFRNKLAQRVTPKGAPIRTDQEKLALSVIRDEDWENPSAQAARRAVTVNLPLTGIHDAQVAFAVYDLTGGRQRSKVASGFCVGSRSVHQGDGSGGHL